MDDPFKELGSKLRGWYNRSPKVQRAYEKLTADVDAVHAKMTSAIEETEALRDIRDKVAAAIDPPAPTAPTGVTSEAAAPPEADVQTAAQAPTPTEATAPAAPPTAATPEAPVEPVVTATTAATPAEPTTQPPTGLPIHTGTMPEGTSPPPPTQGSPLP